MLEVGSRKPWLVRTVLLNIAVIVLAVLSCRVVSSLLSEYGVNAIFLKYALWLSLFLVVPSSYRRCFEIWTTEFTIVDDCLCGVDLWTIQSVRYGRHCVYLDKVCIDMVPRPNVLLDSLEDYYYVMTGGPLP